MMLEGVHLVPGLVEPPTHTENVLVAQCVLEIPDEQAHELHFYVRDVASDGVRPVARYLDRIEEIRRIQSELVGRARREGVAVIDSTDVSRAVTELLELVLDGVEHVERG